MGWSGTFSEKSAFTVIFWPWAGTLMCWYMDQVSERGKVNGKTARDSMSRAVARLTPPGPGAAFFQRAGTGPATRSSQAAPDQHLVPDPVPQRKQRAQRQQRARTPAPAALRARPGHPGAARSTARPRGPRKKARQRRPWPPRPSRRGPSTTRAAAPTARCRRARPPRHAAGTAAAFSCRPGPCTGAQPACTGTRPMPAIQAGCRPCHTIHRPSTSRAPCNSTHSGRSAGLNCASDSAAPTLAAAMPPATA